MTLNTNTENFIHLELTDEIKREQIVTSFKKDKRTNNLFLTLNHVYKQKLIISPIYEGPKWNETVDVLVKKLNRNSVREEHITLIEDVLNYNFEAVSGLTEAIQEQGVSEDETAKRSKKVKIRKYTGNGTLPLRESIVFRDGQTAFVSLDENGRLKYETQLERPGMLLYPADSLDTHNPSPYIFESPEEFEQYLERARNETFESLYFKIKSIYQKYVNIEDHCLSILSADTIYSYFQDKFPTLHYNIFVGDNGSGKNSALLVYRQLGYRVFYVTSASAPNYFTFLGETEECQGTIAEDEGEDIGRDREKQRILKTGYASGGSVPKIDLTFGRTQGTYLTYCMKWLAMEELPDYKKIKGILDRSFVFRFIVGEVEYNIKEVIKNAGDPKFKPLHDELNDLRKRLFAFRRIHHNDIIPDLSLNIKHRNAELTKPLLRLFKSRDDAPVALDEIRRALSKFITERSELKRNSVESKLWEAINNLIKRGSDGQNESKSYTFNNEDIWTEVKAVMNGRDNTFKPDSFYSVDYGSISHKYITCIYKSKFKAEPFKVGSGGDTKRGLKFSKEVLDRQAIYYDVPDEILILDHSDGKPATDATLATHFKNGEGQNKIIDDGDDDNTSSDSTPPSAPQRGAEAVATQIEPINDHKKDEYDNDPNSYNYIDNSDKSSAETNPKEESPSSKCVASVASVAEIEYNTEGSLSASPNSDDKKTDEKDASPFSTSVASVASVADLHKTDSAATSVDEKVAIVEINSPMLPCIWCDFKNPIEFDLGNHILECHKGDLLKLPIGKGSMDNRIDYVIQQIKRMMVAPIDEEYEDEDIAEDNDLDDAN